MKSIWFKVVGILIAAAVVSAVIVQVSDETKVAAIPTPVPGLQRPKENTELAEAKRLRRKGNYAEAAEILKKLLAKEPQNIEALRELALSFLKLGKSEVALPLIESLTRLEPHNGTNHVWLGYLYLQQRKIPEAIREYELAVELFPEGAEKESAVHALAEIRKLLVTSRPLPKIIPSRSGTLGRNTPSPQPEREEKKRYGSTGDNWKSGPFLSERELNPRLDKVKQVREQHGVAAALKLLKTLADEFPEDPEVQRELGIYALESGDLKEALTALQLARKIDPDDWQGQLFLGQAFEQSGDFMKALFAYRASSRRSTDPQYDQWFKEKLSSMRDKMKSQLNAPNPPKPSPK